MSEMIDDDRNDDGDWLEPDDGSPGDSPEQPTGGGPVVVGQGSTPDGAWRTVRQGDCVSSLAKETGHFWETIWNHSLNAQLKDRRKDPNLLFPGDTVFIPNKRIKEESGGADERHRFRRKGEPTYLKLKLLDRGVARGNEAYVLQFGREQRQGTTDDEGRLEEPIPGNTRQVTLRIGGDEYRLNLGQIDPIDEVSGIQARLNNLGFGCGAVDGKFGPKTRAALNLFRESVGLEPSDGIDDETKRKLEQEHDEMMAGSRTGDDVDSGADLSEPFDPDDAEKADWGDEPDLDEGELDDLDDD